MKPINNKYTTWYLALIQSRRDQVKSTDTQRHHIVPRSLGGEDTDDNLVNLTLREHFIAHLLLTKMYAGQASYKMAFALRQMLGSYTPPSSRVYHKIKADANAAMSALWDDSVWAENQRALKRELGSRLEIKEMRSNNMLEVWQRPEYIEKHSAAMQEVYSDPKWIKKNSEKQTEAWKDPVKRENRMKNRKPHSDEIKAIQSASSTAANKRAWADPEIRARRIAGIKAAAAKRRASK